MIGRRTFVASVAALAASSPRWSRAVPTPALPDPSCLSIVNWGSIVCNSILLDAGEGRVWALAPTWAWEYRRLPGEACFSALQEPRGNPLAGLGWWWMPYECGTVRPARPHPWRPTVRETVTIARLRDDGSVHMVFGVVAAVSGGPLAAPVTIAAPFAEGLAGSAVFDAQGRLVGMILHESFTADSRMMGPFHDAVPILGPDSDRVEPPGAPKTRVLGLRFRNGGRGEMVVGGIEDHLLYRVQTGDVIEWISSTDTDGNTVESSVASWRAPIVRRLLASTVGPVDLVLMRGSEEVRVRMDDLPSMRARPGWI